MLALFFKSAKGSGSIDETAVLTFCIRGRESNFVCMCVLSVCEAVLLIHIGRLIAGILPQRCLFGFTGLAEAATLQRVTGGCVCVCLGKRRCVYVMIKAVC